MEQKIQKRAMIDKIGIRCLESRYFV